MFTCGGIVLSLPKRALVDWNWPISREKYLKIDWSVKMALYWLIMGVAGLMRLLARGDLMMMMMRLLVMGSCIKQVPNC